MSLGLSFGGGLGVTIFFFISGYLITTLLRREFDRNGRIALGDFYLRRAFKIMPPMYLSIAFGVLVTLVGLVPLAISIGGVTASALYFANYWRALGIPGIPEPMFILWSLAVEEHFYLLFPILYIVLRRFVPRVRRQVLVLVAICIAVLAWRCYLYFAVGVAWQPMNIRTDTRLDALLWGCVLAIGFNPALDPPRGPDFFWKWIAAPLGAIVTVVANRGVGFESHVGYTLQSLGIGVIVVSVVRFPKFFAFRPLNWKPVIWLGDLSYSFYLVHYYFIYWADTHLDMSGVSKTAVAFVLTVLMAWGMYRLVETPFAILRKRRSHAGEETAQDEGHQIVIDEAVRAPR